MLSLQLLVTSLVVTEMVWGSSSSVGAISSVSFTKLEKFLEMPTVYHMELDRYKNDGSILFSTSGYLKTTNGKTTDNIATLSSTFIPDFVQLDSARVVLVDRSNHCLRIVNRNGNRLQPLAGTCGLSGYVEGRVGNSRLYNPRGAVVDIRNPSRLLVIDEHNDALRSVDLRTGVLGTVIKTGFNNPRSMMWVNNKLYVSNYHYISEVKWSNNGTVTNTVVAGSRSSGYVNGGFDMARFYLPHDVVDMGDNLYLIADYQNFKLRIMNMKTRQVDPVCFNGELPCVTGSRLPSSPSSLLVVGQDIYIGMSSDIYKLSGGKALAPTSPSTPALTASCPHENVTAYVDSGKDLAKVQLACGQVGYLPPGVYPFAIEQDSNRCDYFVKVLRPSVIRTAVFQVKYDVKCSSINSASKALLQSVLLHRRQQLEPVCADDCSLSSSRDPWYRCENDVLVVSWPTDRVFPVDTKVLPAQFTNAIKQSLSVSSLGAFEITILSHSPPVVVAKKNSEGEPIEIGLSSGCVDKTMTYNVAQDTCT